MPRSGSFILGIKSKSQGLAAKGILRLPHRWQRVVHNAGDYSGGQ